MQVRGIFGFVGEDHIGKVMFPPVQVITHGLHTFSYFLKCLESIKISFPLRLLIKMIIDDRFNYCTGSTVILFKWNVKPTDEIGEFGACVPLADD